MITNTHDDGYRNRAAVITALTTTDTDTLDRIADAEVPYFLTAAALAVLDTEPSTAGTRPMQRAEWAVRLPSGQWYRDGVASAEPGVYRTRAAAEVGAAHMIAIAEAIAAEGYAVTLYVRPVVIDGTGARVGAWAPVRGE